MSKAGFKITRGTGFHITFENGYTVSVQFGTYNYCENQRMEFPSLHMVLPSQVNVKSSDAEVAVWRTGDDGIVGDFIDLPQFGIDQVAGYKSPEEILEILNWAKEQK